MKQPDLICTNCPLEECSEESLWCMFRLLTKPNAAQREFVSNRVMIRKTSRQRYDAKRYEAKKRETELATTTP